MRPSFGATSPATVPRRFLRRVIAEKKPSTALSREAEVGGK
jgi:hypothetical protein